MGETYLNTQLAAPYVNATMVFVFVLLVHWFLKAVKRLYRVILLRRAVQSGSVVQIQGLGSYLSYFDGATRNHLNSIVQTRQAKPPIPVDVVYVSLYMESVKLALVAADQFVLELKFSAFIPGKLYLVTKFNSANFKEAIHHVCKQRKAQGHTTRDANLILRETIFHTERAQYAPTTGSVSLPYLVQRQIAQNEGFVHECRVGSQAINISISSPMQNPSDESLYSIALCFVPDLQTQVNIHSPPVTRKHTRGESKKNDIELSYMVANSYSPTDDPLSSRSEDGNSIREAQGLLHEQSPAVYRSISNFFQTVIERVRSIFPSLSPVPRSQSESALTSDPNADPNVDHDPTTAASPDSFTLPAEAFGKSLAAGVVYSFQLPSYLPKFFRDPVPVVVAPTTPVTPAIVVSGVEVKKAGGATTKKAAKKAPQQQQHALATPAAPLTLPKRRALHPRELLLIDTQGRVYLSAEIFGLGAMNDSDSGDHNTNGPASTAATGGVGVSSKGPPSSPTVVLPNSGVNAARVLPTGTDSSHPSSQPHSNSDNNDSVGNNTAGSSNEASEQQGSDANSATAAATVVSSLNAAQGGKYLHEECVVCLTDPKEVLLLPCRHLCVCYSCFAYVDKCPVCRAFFEEYLRIEINTKVSIGSASPRQALL